MTDTLHETLADEIEVVHIDDLEPYGNNPKEHSPEQVRKIATSIEEFGYTVPIIVDENNVIIAGHGRAEAIKNHVDGIEEVSVIRRTDLDDDQIRAFRIADNRLAESPWDLELLETEYEELDHSDYDTDVIGFTPDELDEMFGDWKEGEESGSDTEYTDKIDAPVYEPTGEKPHLSKLMDTSKSEELIEKIEAADLPEGKERFLTLAAYRHIVFDYEQIAEYYAHADPVMQELMEELTLVIVDYEQAIEQGFIEFAERFRTEVDDDP